MTNRLIFSSVSNIDISMRSVTDQRSNLVLHIHSSHHKIDSICLLDVCDITYRRRILWIYDNI